MIQQEKHDSKKAVNKDLILREKLAIERTDMAIDRTLLSFIRTSLYFAVAGLTINSLLQETYGDWIGILFLVISGVVLLVGIYKYQQQKKRLHEYRRHVGNYVLDREADEE